jgi:hypothetical protein
MPPDPPVWVEGVEGTRVIPLVETLGDISHEFPGIVVSRRSTRQFTGASVDRRDLDRVLDFSHRYATPGPVRYLNARSALQIHLVMNRVRGLEQGVWRYLPDEHQLQLIRSGDERRRVHGACLGQELARDAACLLVYSADLPRAVEVWGDRSSSAITEDELHNIISAVLDRVAPVRDNGATAIESEEDSQ